MTRYLGMVVLLGLLTGSIHLGADDAITIRVSPLITFARGYAQLTVLVERNELNRALIWEVDGPDYFRSSLMELDGAAAPRSWHFIARDLPEGEYAIRATVRRADDSQSVAVARIRVLAGTH